MENIDPKLLRAFLHVADEGSFSNAARSLDLSPNTVSLRIRTLERRLGTRLFDRCAQGMRLAPSGFGLLPAARELVEMNDRLFEHAASMSAPESAGSAPAPGVVAAGSPDDRTCPRSPLRTVSGSQAAPPRPER